MNSWLKRTPNIKYLISPNITHVCVSGGTKCFFFGNFGVLCFPETPVLRFTFLPYSRREIDSILFKKLRRIVSG